MGKKSRAKKHAARVVGFIPSIKAPTVSEREIQERQQLEADEKEAKRKRREAMRANGGWVPKNVGQV